MPKIKNLPIRLLLAVFAVDVLVMIVELCASYLAYPYFGNAQAVWIAIITMILLGNSIGNILGGKLSQKAQKTGRNYISTAFIIAGMCISLVLLLSDKLFPTLTSFIHSSTLSALIGSLLLFLPCTICFGTISPQVMYAISQKENYTGETTGLIYALSTIGGLCGTLIGGFILIPLIGCRTILIVCIIAATVIGIVELSSKKELKAAGCITVSAICIIVSIMSQIQSSNWETRPYGSATFDSQYNRITIQNYTEENGSPARAMSMASGFESATYLDENRYELIFDYLKTYDKYTLQNVNQPINTLLIGGAAFQYPKYVLSHYENARIDVAEIDSEVVRLAKKYFFLQECIDSYDKMGERMDIHIEDGRKYVETTAQTYDVIYNDAFSGDTPPATLTTAQFISLVKNKLSPNGIYAINIIDKSDTENAKWLKAECFTLSQYFKNIYIVQNHPLNERTNYVVFATDANIDIAEAINLDYSDGILLTDNYHPIDSLIQ